MRKTFTIVVVVFLIVATGLSLFFDKSQSDSLSILTIKQNYQRLITEDELLSITMYLSNEKSYISDTNNIDSLYLMDEFNQIEVGVSEIRKLDYTETFQNTKYYAYVMDLNFEVVNVTDFLLELKETSLVINYLNGTRISLEIGYVNLNFKEYINPNYIDVNRMFALYKEADFEYISGLVLGVKNLTGFEVVINSISLCNHLVSLDVENSLKLTDIPEHNEDINELLNYEYNPIGEVESMEGLEVFEEDLIFIPLKYKTELMNISRFPLVIEFTYNQGNYSYYIDDFQFNSQKLGLEVNSGRIREFIYNY